MSTLEVTFEQTSTNAIAVMSQDTVIKVGLEGVVDGDPTFTRKDNTVTLSFPINSENQQGAGEKAQLMLDAGTISAYQFV